MTNVEETKKVVSPTQIQTFSVEKMYELLMRREVRDLAKEQQELDRKAAQQAQLEKNAIEDQVKFLAQQVTCNHLKGMASKGDARKSYQVPDHNVYQHTFIDGSTYIKCMNCRAKWIRKDTVDYLFRGGKYISNHTKIGWREAVQLMNTSTNKGSSSEIPVQVNITSIADQIRNANDLGVAALLPKDKDGNSVSDVQY